MPGSAIRSVAGCVAAVALLAVASYPAMAQ